MSKGWIKVHREVQDCWIWQDKPYDKARAWIDILLSCNHADKKIMFNGNFMTITRGQWLTSILNLSDRWGWSRHKVSDFLNILADDNMLIVEKDTKRTLITVVNYNVYQDYESEEGHQKDNTRTSEGHQKDINNNDKELKKENNINNKPIRHKYGEYENVLLSDTDMEKLKNEFPSDYEERIDRLSAYMRSTGKSYKDHLATIRNWARKETKTEPKPTKAANKFNNFESSRKYDFSDLERMVNQ